MSALMFTRDERRMAFVPVTVAAMEAIREATPKGRPYAVATYVALLELANDRRGDRVAITYSGLVEIIGAGRTTVKQALASLVAAGVVEIREQTHGRGQIENEYVVVEPPARRGDESDTPGRVATGGRSLGDHPASARPSQPSAARSETEKEESQEARAPSEIDQVFDEWVKATDRPTRRTKLTGERRSTIKQALADYGLADCLAAVRGIGASPDARTGYGRGGRYDDVKHALSNAERIERWRDFKPPLAEAGNVHPIRRGSTPTNGDLLRAVRQRQESEHMTIEGTARDLG